VEFAHDRRGDSVSDSVDRCDRGNRLDRATDSESATVIVDC
jgi:hypothetical protein